MTVTPPITVRQGKTLRERREHLWIKKLRRLSFFHQIVKKLVDGQGVASVARWCHEQNPEGELHNKTPETWRKYLTSVAMHVRNDLKEVRRFKVEPLAYKVLMGELEKEKVATTELDPVVETARPIWSEVKKAARDLDAETMLKYCFVIQQARLQAMLALEGKLNLLVPHGYKEVGVLVKIAAEIRQYEASEQRMKVNGKVPNPVKGVTQENPLPHEPWLSDKEKRFRELDEGERSRSLTAARQVVDKIIKEVIESSDSSVKHVGVSASSAREIMEA